MSRRRGEPPPAPEPLPSPVADSHCHLDSIETATVTEVLEQAQAVNVGTLITSGDDLASSRWAATIAYEHADIWATVAIHPNELTGVTDDDWAELAELAARPDVRAVGETGLDAYWERVDDATQEDGFRRHIALAKQVGKPLVIHDREAHERVLAMLRSEGAPDTVVFHSFSGDTAMARECVEAGYVLSFSGVLTFRNAPALREAAALVPGEQLLVETDAPFLTPHPYRGRPNACYLVPLTVRGLAETRGEEVAQTCAALARTAQRVFQLSTGDA